MKIVQLAFKGVRANATHLDKDKLIRQMEKELDWLRAQLRREREGRIVAEGVAKLKGVGHSDWHNLHSP